MEDTNPLTPDIKKSTKFPFYNKINIIATGIITFGGVIGVFREYFIQPIQKIFPESFIGNNVEFRNSVNFYFISEENSERIKGIKIISPKNIIEDENNEFQYKTNQFNLKQEIVYKLPNGIQKVDYLQIDSLNQKPLPIYISND